MENNETKINEQEFRELSDEELSQVFGGGILEAATQVAANIAAQDSALAKESLEAFYKNQAESSFTGGAKAAGHLKASALFKAKPITAEAEMKLFPV